MESNVEVGERDFWSVFRTCVDGLADIETRKGNGRDDDDGLGEALAIIEARRPGELSYWARRLRAGPKYEVWRWAVANADGRLLSVIAILSPSQVAAALEKADQTRD